MRIASKQANVRVRSSYPNFLYSFEFADTPIEVKDEHAAKVLLNPMFYESDKDAVKETDVFDVLLEIKGIGKETVSDIKKVFANLEDLKFALAQDDVPLRNDAVDKLRAYFGIAPKDLNTTKASKNSK